MKAAHCLLTYQWKIPVQIFQRTPVPFLAVLTLHLTTHQYHQHLQIAAMKPPAAVTAEDDMLSTILLDQQKAWKDTTADEQTDDSATAHPIGLDPEVPLDHQMICDIQKLASRLAAKSAQLLGVTQAMSLMVIILLFIQVTLLPEGCMHIHSKFDGGKQVNHSQSGSWEGRCAGTALQVNEGPTWGPTYWGKSHQY